MIASAKKNMTALVSVSLVAVAVSACSENGSRTTDPPSETVDPPPETVSDLIHMATGADGMGSGGPPMPDASASAVAYFASVRQTVSGPRYVVALPWHDEPGDINFTVSMALGGTTGRFVDTSSSAGTSFDEDTHHGLGGDWRAFEIRRGYTGAGTWTINVATDAADAHALEQPWVGYAPFQRLIELRDVPALPAGQDWQYALVENPFTGTMQLAGSLNGVPGHFSCLIGGCYLEFDRRTEAAGYHPGGTDVLFTPDDPGLPATTLPSVTAVDRMPAANYLVFGTWLYVPEDIESSGEYDLGALAGGGEPYSSPVGDLVGTATYAGSASGMYFAGRSSESPSVDSFEADVTLTADFDDGELGGRVDNIRYDAAAAGLPSELHLETTIIVTEEPSPFLLLPSGVAVAVGVVSDGQPTSSWAGEWNAAFYGNGANPTDHPTGVAGTFGASNGDDGLLGGFGAYRQ